MAEKDQLIVHDASLKDHLLGLVRYLRTQGYLVGIDEVTSALKGIPLINLGDRTSFLNLMKIVFTSSAEQWNTFDDVYRSYLSEHKQAENAKKREKGIKTDDAKPAAPAKKEYQLSDIKKWLFNEKAETIETPFYSTSSSDEVGGLSLGDNQEREIGILVQRLVRKLAIYKSRKYVRNRHKGVLNQKILLKNKVRRGDELLNISFRYRRRETSKIVLLCDVSKSMQLYSHFMTQFVHALQSSFTRHAVYAFNTQLFRLPEHWLAYDWVDTIRSLTEIPGLWRGGTKIGRSLHDLLTFNLPGWFDQRTKVIIFSDGWDTGEMDLLSDSMKELSEKSGLLIWMNPVFQESSENQIVGLKTIQPYVDILAPVHDLHTLEHLVRRL